MLFRLPLRGIIAREYAPSHDGQRFIAVSPSEGSSQSLTSSPELAGRVKEQVTVIASRRLARTAGSATHPRIPSRLVQEVEVGAEYGEPAVGGSRFFYLQTLKRAWSVAETPYPKKVLKLPIILSQEEEVARLINAALTPFHRIVLMTLYATGVRRAELARLKISDIA